MPMYIQRTHNRAITTDHEFVEKLFCYFGKKPPRIIGKESLRSGVTCAVCKLVMTSEHRFILKDRQIFCQEKHQILE